MSLVPLERIEQKIFMVRGQRVMLDADLAALFGVSTKRLNEQVKRNSERFPSDFMMRLTAAEAADVAAAGADLRSQTATSKDGRGGRRFLPFAFTEHGAIMAANVLNSRQAVEASVHVVRAFVRLRQWMGAQRELATKLAELEQRIGPHDEAIGEFLTAIHELMDPPIERRRERIGFR